MEEIRIRGARQHNLKNVNVDIPRGRLVVITGPSGSGKSSLAFHTLYAEGRRRYVESLSAYARQFLDQMEKPDVDSIEGLSPAIAIEQRGGGLNPRSTVATATEIYDYLRVLWASAGTPHDPVTGERLEKMTAGDIVGALEAMKEGTRVVLLAPVPAEEAVDARRLMGDLKRRGFVRVRVDGEMMEVEEAPAMWPEHPGVVEVVVDRVVVRPGGGSRLADSVETALGLWGAEVRAVVRGPDEDAERDISFQTAWRNPSTGFVIGALTPRHFSFNSHLGCCPVCEGLGTESFCDPSLVVGDPTMPTGAGGIRGWWKPGGARGKTLVRDVSAVAGMFGVAEDTPWERLPTEARELILFGGELGAGSKVGAVKTKQIKRYEGLCPEAERKIREARSEAVRRRLARVMSHRPCRVCGGRRLTPAVLAVKLQGGDGEWLGIQDFCGLPVERAIRWLAELHLPPGRAEICRRVADDVACRLGFLDDVGLGYLGLDRASGTLSGGEAQRIRLATQLGAGLSGVLYVLDEPSIGLHPADTGRLIRALYRLRDLGNTVVVVEHDEEMIRAADWMIELGPGAGSSGGYVLAAGLPLDSESPTGRWLRGEDKRPAHASPGGPGLWVSGSPALRIRGAREHNLRGINVTIPLGRLVCLTGPSGSGKSTLADDILRRALARHFGHAGDTPGAHDGIDGIGHIEKVVVVDQSPVGRNPRSNPATFTGLFDLIRDLFAHLPLSRQRGYGAGRFSFNNRGGRCENCEGAGKLKIEMHFLPDAWVECTSCRGRRFNRETLEATFKGRSIADILDMTVADALMLFRAMPKPSKLLQTLDDLGLGYLHLGQAANTLSGGEAQRLKLALELSRPAAPHTFYLLDEPTTGLHFGDVRRLLDALTRLRDAGHSVLVIEHHPDVIAAADWVIDLGPGGGVHGGHLVAEGTPAELVRHPESATGRALAAQLSNSQETNPRAHAAP